MSTAIGQNIAGQKNIYLELEYQADNWEKCK